jgi:hypothetical protein
MNNALGVRLNIIKIGKALTTLNYERIKHSKRQVYGYLIKAKNRRIKKRQLTIDLPKLPPYLN